MANLKEAVLNRTYLTLAVVSGSSETTVDGKERDLVPTLANFVTALVYEYEGDYEVRTGFKHERVPRVKSRAFNAPPWTDWVEWETISFPVSDWVKLARPKE